MSLRDEYAKRVLSQIPRILSMEDRNKYSRTYGCFDRIYWLDKAIDFPSAIMQFAVHSLALVYAKNFPNNPYYKNENIKDWCLAGIEYWIKIQKKDGSFDEFYPNEHGWAGPTGFLLYAMMDSYHLLKNNINEEFKAKIFETAKRSALYLAEYDEIGILANHHAIALLSIYYTYKTLGDKEIMYNFDEKFKYFLSLQSDEGWFLEYDGADPGYLSATISFLAKLYKIMEDNEKKKQILHVAKKAVKFSSYFVYPNGFYAGTIGSRQTLHFYPHGYEVFGKQIPLAQAVAEKMLVALSEGKLVPPEIMPYRYLPYRTSEYLLAYLDYCPRSKNMPKLPYEKKYFEQYFKEAKIYVKKNDHYYAVCNLAKGGVIKAFDLKTKKLVINDCGIIGLLNSNKTVSSQWVDNDYKIRVAPNSAEVVGKLHVVDTMHPTPFKNILFRLFLLTFARNPKLAYKIKGLIRSLIILKNKKVPIEFRRSFKFADNLIETQTDLKLLGADKFTLLSIGGEFAVRYVPQSLYFQSQELEIESRSISKKEIDKLNNEKILKIISEVDFSE